VILPRNKLYSFKGNDLISDIMIPYFSHEFMIDGTLKALFYKQAVDRFACPDSFNNRPQAINAIGFFHHNIILILMV
jgi:hypothetical protein